MRLLRYAAVCCLISMFAVLPFKAKTAEKIGKCQLPNVETAYQDSKAVFVGKVLDVSKDGDVKTFTFKIERYWKGTTSEEIQINVRETMRYQAWFQVGESYLVYARGDEDNDKLWEIRCSRSKSLTDASEDLTELGKAKKPVKK